MPILKLQAFLPLVTYPDANSEIIAPNAAAVAHYLGADLHALALEADIPAVSNALSNVLMNLPEMILDAEKLSARRGADLLAAVTAACATAEVALTTETIRGHLPLLSGLAAEQARYHDISLVGWSEGNAGTRMLAEAVVFGSGRPTLLFPEAVSEVRLGHVAVAWDASRVAARALADARPLLKRASAVTVVMITDEKPLSTVAGEKLAGHLRELGLPAQLQTFRLGGRPVAQALQNNAAVIGANVLVMGGFGHSRLRDFVLGGATEGVLADLKMPVLLSH